jgi:hypothetical protein
MKKIASFLSGIILLMVVIVATCSFNSVNNASDDDQTCQVTVLTNDGEPAKYVKVSTEVSGNPLSCCGGRTFETNKNGVAILYWVKGCKLTKVYVKGTAYKVDYKDGGSYTLTLK